MDWGSIFTEIVVTRDLIWKLCIYVSNFCTGTPLYYHKEMDDSTVILFLWQSLEGIGWGPLFFSRLVPSLLHVQVQFCHHLLAIPTHYLGGTLLVVCSWWLFVVLCGSFLVVRLWWLFVVRSFVLGQSGHTFPIHFLILTKVFTGDSSVRSKMALKCPCHWFSRSQPLVLSCLTV